MCRLSPHSSLQRRANVMHRLVHPCTVLCEDRTRLPQDLDGEFRLEGIGFRTAGVVGGPY